MHLSDEWPRIVIRFAGNISALQIKISLKSLCFLINIFSKHSFITLEKSNMPSKSIYNEILLVPKYVKLLWSMKLKIYLSRKISFHYSNNWKQSLHFLHMRIECPLFCQKCIMTTTGCYIQQRLLVKRKIGGLSYSDKTRFTISYCYKFLRVQYLTPLSWDISYTIVWRKTCFSFKLIYHITQKEKKICRLTLKVH